VSQPDDNLLLINDEPRSCRSLSSGTFHEPVQLDACESLVAIINDFRLTRGSLPQQRQSE
jgi:hypothetical protein